MNKKLFNSLTIIEQINYFNERLKHGLNITQVCSEINISYNTIRDRFSKNFYVYNKLNKILQNGARMKLASGRSSGTLCKKSVDKVGQVVLP